MYIYCLCWYNFFCGVKSTFLVFTCVLAFFLPGSSLASHDFFHIRNNLHFRNLPRDLQDHILSDIEDIVTAYKVKSSKKNSYDFNQENLHEIDEEGDKSILKIRSKDDSLTPPAISFEARDVRCDLLRNIFCYCCLRPRYTFRFHDGADESSIIHLAKALRPSHSFLEL